jgi:hypothetical protein
MPSETCQSQTCQSHTWHTQMCQSFSFFFIFWQYWSLNSGTCTC